MAFVVVAVVTSDTHQAIRAQCARHMPQENVREALQNATDTLTIVYFLYFGTTASGWLLQLRSFTARACNAEKQAETMCCIGSYSRPHRGHIEANGEGLCLSLVLLLHTTH